MTNQVNVQKQILDARETTYGHRPTNMANIAKVWSGITGLDIQPHHVPLMMIGMKAVRAATTPDYSDNTDDIDGYNKIFREVVGDDMVEAQSVAEYLEQKAGKTPPKPEEFCVNCRTNTCDGNCEEERLADELAMGKQWGVDHAETFVIGALMSPEMLSYVRVSLNQANAWVRSNTEITRLAMEAATRFLKVQK